MSTLSLKAIEVAKLNLSEHEEPKGSNAGKDVEEFLSAVGLGPGYAWCMAFVYFCFWKASEEWDIVNPLTKTGGVLNQWNKHPELRQSIPEVGDILIMDFGKGRGHTGIVYKVDATYIYTIEGNTNDEGGREGYEVAYMKRKRTEKTIKGYLRA